LQRQDHRFMYYLIATHSLLRYLVLSSILVVIYLAWEGLFFKRPLTRLHRISAAVASGISHVQLLLGFVLYFESPTVQGYYAQKPSGWSDGLFFAFIHFGLMSIAIVLLTIGVALAKREADDRARHRILLNYFSIALFLILVAIPWPFSPLAERPWIRDF
jgi:uncharacterized membrane protein YozB (DUF420 family)